jgi:hypothetical protein
MNILSGVKFVILTHFYIPRRMFLLRLSKSFYWIVSSLIVLCGTELLQGQTVFGNGPTSPLTPNIPSSNPYTITKQDGNSCEWEQTVYETNAAGMYETNAAGEVMSEIDRYIELATGLNYFSNGQWIESQEEIDALPQGGAEAIQGQHQAYWPGDIYNGQIELVTPGGVKLFSRPVGLSYDDGTNTVMIAALTNSTGVLVSSNQVVYPNAFAGCTADLMYTYTKAGFEQDVILKEQPPSPASLGCNPDTTRIQVLTEFFDPPQPAVTSATVPTDAGNLTDDQLDFGTMLMGHGRAFLLGTNAPGVQVSKQWLLLDGRQFLVEEVPVADMAEALESLPLPATQTSSTTTAHSIPRHLILPPQRMARVVPAVKRIQLAKAALPVKGFVLDYQTINSSLTNYTFQNDTTYYISGAVDLFGLNNTFEGGAVLKYASGAMVEIMSGSQFNWQAGAYRPVILTAKDDNTAGQTISGSTGSPTGYYAEEALNFSGVSSNSTLSGFRIAYAQTAILTAYAEGGVQNFDNGQLVNCQNGFYCNSESINVRNVLFANVQTNFQVIWNATVDAQNSTFSGSSSLTPNISNGSLSLENCILANVTALTHYLGAMSGTNNGFYNSPEFGTGPVTNTFFPFQTVVAGSYYLTNGCSFFNAGTTNIDPVLLASLPQKTTYPPVLITNNFTLNTTLIPRAPRDIDTPDIGYHYDPLDYVWSNRTVNSGVTLTLNNGVAVGMYGSSGLTVYGTLISQGGATTLDHIEPIGNIQEGAVSAPVGTLIGGNGLWQSLTLSFTETTLNSQTLLDVGTTSDYTMSLNNCQLHGGTLTSEAGPLTVNFNNNLLDRCDVNVWKFSSGYGNVNFGNNLFRGGTLYLYYDCISLTDYTSEIWSFYNNLFDHATVAEQGSDDGENYWQYGIHNSHNGYVSSSNLLNSAGGDKFPSIADYQAGPLGNYYYPTNGGNLSTLINAGTTNANLLGLYHYTTTTNQVTETNSVVDIGFHYVAVDAYGNPLDTAGDGIPDYIADSNGDGMYDAGDLSNWTNSSTSMGKDFWLAFSQGYFQYMEDGHPSIDLTLSISSPEAATGTVTCYLDGAVTVSGCGDPNVNGTYIATNISEQEDNLAADNFGNIIYEFVKGTNQLIWASGGIVGIIGYDEAAGSFSYLYVKGDADLNGANWSSWGDDPFTQPPTNSVVSQVALSQSFSVIPRTIATVAIPVQAMLTDYDVVKTNSIHVAANEAVSVYALTYQYGASTAFNAYPTVLLGTNYCLMAHESGISPEYSGFYSQFTVVATTNNTTVRITPSSSADLAGTLWVNPIVLQQGQSYQINSSGPYNDVTGTMVVSDEPIAVFSGANFATVPDGVGLGNPLGQEQVPVALWGTNALAISLSGRLYGDRYRILTVASNTVTITSTNGIIVTNLAAGTFCETNLDGPVTFQGREPIQVAQFANGGDFDDPSGYSPETQGDPCEILLPPAGHYLTSYTVIASAGVDDWGLDYDFGTNYLSLIVGQSGISTTFVDGSAVASTNFTAIGSSGYYGAQIPVSGGNGALTSDPVTNACVHTVTSSQPVDVQVYGWGNADSYGWIGGWSP